MSVRVARTLLAVLAGVVLVSPVRLRAQPGTQRGAEPCLELADVLRLVRLRHPALAAASAARQSATALARHDAAYADPAVEWRREGSAGEPLTDDFFTVTQSFDLTGRRLALRSAASAVGRRALADSTTTARAAEADAVRAFWRARLARALLELAAEQRADAVRLAATESVRAREGAIAESWAMRTSLEAERARFAEGSAEAEWARARAELARAVALSIDSLPDVLPLEPVSAATERAPALDAALALASTGRSELAAASAARDVAQRRERAATLGLLGDMALQAGQKRTAGRTVGVLAVVLPVPLWNRNAPARALATADRRAAEAASRATDVTVAAEVSSAVESYRALLAARPPAGAALGARATEVARIAEEAYAAGGASLLELLDARRARVETLAALLRWSAELRLAQLELARATGQSFTDLPETP